jgi:hypothetical protein
VAAASKARVVFKYSKKRYRVDKRDAVRASTEKR